jgi:hypothetical protein
VSVEQQGIVERAGRVLLNLALWDQGAAAGGASDVGGGWHQLGYRPDSAACRSALGRRPGGAGTPRPTWLPPASAPHPVGHASHDARLAAVCDWYLRPMTTPDVVRKVRQLDNDVQSIYEMLAKIEATQNRHGNRLGEIATTIGEMDSKIGEMDGKLNEILDLLRKR